VHPGDDDATFPAHDRGDLRATVLESALPRVLENQLSVLIADETTSSVSTASPALCGEKRSRAAGAARL
jgi:hypothetical protein